MDAGSGVGWGIVGTGSISSTVVEQLLATTGTRPAAVTHSTDRGSGEYGGRGFCGRGGRYALRAFVWHPSCVVDFIQRNGTPFFADAPLPGGTWS